MFPLLNKDMSTRPAFSSQHYQLSGVVFFLFLTIPGSLKYVITTWRTNKIVRETFILSPTPVVKTKIYSQTLPQLQKLLMILPLNEQTPVWII